MSLRAREGRKRETEEQGELLFHSRGKSCRREGVREGRRERAARFALLLSRVSQYNEQYVLLLRDREEEEEEEEEEGARRFESRSVVWGGSTRRSVASRPCSRRRPRRRLRSFGVHTAQREERRRERKEGEYYHQTDAELS